ncbi:MAG TPA: hypothetical protein VFI17_10435 [Solirubrobacterales bacterium]|nr:hypothetical protein [Solirubrobacterales bacterium]
MTRFFQATFNAAPRQRGRWLALSALACSLLLLVGIGSSSEAAGVGKTTVILGSTSTVPDPSCPEMPCQAIGSVTGFQVNNGQTQLPFRVTADGTIKAWTLTLAQPTNSQRSFFNGFFGTPPEARLAILRRVPGSNPPRYNLRRQGSIKVLTPYLGQTVKFGANLRVEKDDIVGLTVPTWAPAFAQNLTANNVWRASRSPGTCTNSTDIRQGEPQQKVGTRATYGCKYTTARLLYTATLVLDK